MRCWLLASLPFLLLVAACADDAASDHDTATGAVDSAAVNVVPADHSTPRIVPRVRPAIVAEHRYPPLPAKKVARLSLDQVGKLAVECRDMLRAGCQTIYERGAALTRDRAELKAEHVQYLFDFANELARQTLWEDGELTEDRFAAEDSKAPAPGAAATLAGVTRAERIYIEISERFPGSPWEAQAAFERARLYCNGLSGRWDESHRDRARRLFAEVVRDHPKTPQASLAARELEKLGRKGK